MKASRAGVIRGKKGETREQVQIRRSMILTKQHIALAEAGHQDPAPYKERLARLESRYALAGEAI